LATICTVYVAICMVRTAIRWLKYFASTRETAVMGRYTLVLFLKLRLRQFAWELCQITALLIILAYVIYSHYTLGNST